MSSLINKAKDKIQEISDKNSNKTDNSRSDNYGSYGNDTANKLDPTIDSDRDGRNNPSSRVGGYGNTQATDSYGTTGGAGGFASSDTYGSNTNNPGYNDSRSSNTGPHSSNLTNKADPRVDSDRDGRNDPTSRYGGTGNTQQYGDNYAQAGGAGGLATSDTSYGGNTGNYHDKTTTSGGYGSGTTGYAGTDTTRDSGYAGASDNYDSSRSSNTGPHSSNLMNKADPRVDSDNDYRNNPTSRAGGYGRQTDDYGSTTGGYGATARNTDGYGADTATSGYGDTNTRSGYGAGDTTSGYGAGNTASGYGDDTTRSGYGASNLSSGYGDNTTSGGNYGDSSYTPGSGNAKKTAGPHNSDMVNKLDPRVDSDMDGSKTYGGDRTSY